MENFSIKFAVITSQNILFLIFRTWVHSLGPEENLCYPALLTVVLRYNLVKISNRFYFKLKKFNLLSEHCYTDKKENELFLIC
jgi:hypothetical protein